MAQSRHYSPKISRFLVGVLYYEARRRQMPMTRLTDELLRQQLVGSESWQEVEKLKIEESPSNYPDSSNR